MNKPKSDMKKSLFLFVTLLFSLAVSAQTQQGYVKTKGRLAKDGTVIPGQRIPSASVILKGGNSTVSGDNGEFSLLLPENKFFLQNVTKETLEKISEVQAKIKE